MLIRSLNYTMGCLLALILLAPMAQAGSVTCTGTLITPDDRFATLGSASDCEGLFEGNTSQNNITAFGEDWDILVKDVYTDDDTPQGFNGTSFDAFLINGASNGPSESLSGTWSIDQSKLGQDAEGNTYNEYVIALKPDGMHGYWLVDALAVNGIVSGTYSDLSHGLSHANLYGRYNELLPPAEIPLPAAAWLFGSALMGLGLVRRRKA